MASLKAAMAVAFLVAVTAAPSTSDPWQAEDLIAHVIDAYGGREALARAGAVKQRGRVTSLMRQGVEGSIERAYERPDKLRVAVEYPSSPREVRVLSGTRGWRNGSQVSGALYDAMRLQAARFELPLSLLEEGNGLEVLRDVERAGRTLKAVMLTFGDKMSLTVEIEPESGHIVRSTGNVWSEMAGRSVSLEFVTEYHDFRNVEGVLFAFLEVNYANGRHTGNTTLESIEISSSLPAATFQP